MNLFIYLFPFQFYISLACFTPGLTEAIIWSCVLDLTANYFINDNDCIYLFIYIFSCESDEKIGGLLSLSLTHVILTIPPAPL